MSEPSSETVIAGYSIDFTRLSTAEWAACILLALIMPPVGIGFAIGLAAKPVEDGDD